MSQPFQGGDPRVADPDLVDPDREDLARENEREDADREDGVSAGDTEWAGSDAGIADTGIDEPPGS